MKRASRKLGRASRYEIYLARMRIPPRAGGFIHSRSARRDSLSSLSFPEARRVFPARVPSRCPRDRRGKSRRALLRLLSRPPPLCRSIESEEKRRFEGGQRCACRSAKEESFGQARARASGCSTFRNCARATLRYGRILPEPALD